MKRADFNRNERVRDECARIFESALSDLSSILLDKAASPGQKVQIASIMARYGFPGHKTILIEKDEWFDIVCKSVAALLQDEEKYDEWTRNLSQLIPGLK